MATHNFTSVKPLQCPINRAAEIYNKADHIDQELHATYHSIVDSLFYIDVKSRPDMAVVACILGQNMKKFTHTHLKAVHHVLQHLRGTSMYDLSITPGQAIAPCMYTEDTWGCEINPQRKSCSGVLIYYCNAHIINEPTTKICGPQAFWSRIYGII